MACLTVNTDESQFNSYEYLQTNFGQYIDYCEAQVAASPVTATVSLTVNTLDKTFTVVITTVFGGPTSTANTGSGVPITTAIQSPAQGNSTALSNTGSLNSSTTTSTVTSASEPPSELSTASDAETTSEPASNKAWVAGPVAGGIVVAATSIGVFLFLRRRTKRRALAIANVPDHFEKPQLHSDHLPRPKPPELEATEWQEPVELPAEDHAPVSDTRPYEMEGSRPAEMGSRDNAEDRTNRQIAPQ